MKHIILTLAAAATTAILCAAPASHAETTQLSKGQIRLTKMLAGRVAGEPENCIRMMPNVDLTIIDKTALVYKDGGTLWVNYTRDPDDIDDRDTLVTRRFGSTLCSTDIVTKSDLTVGMYTGNLFLAEFIPYRKASSKPQK